MRVNYARAISLLLVSLVLAPAHAGGDGAAWTLDRLMGALARTSIGTVRFVEERRFQLLSEPLILEGTLSYAGGRLEKRTLKPEKELAVIENGRMRVSSPALARPRTILLSDVPALEAFISSLRATLEGDLERLKRDFWVGFKASGADWRMILTPLSQTAREEIEDVVVSGRGVRIASIEIVEGDGDRTIIRISDE